MRPNFDPRQHLYGARGRPTHTDFRPEPPPNTTEGTSMGGAPYMRYGEYPRPLRMSETHRDNNYYSDTYIPNRPIPNLPPTPHAVRTPPTPVYLGPDFYRSPSPIPAVNVKFHGGSSIPEIPRGDSIGPRYRVGSEYGSCADQYSSMRGEQYGMGVYPFTNTGMNNPYPTTGISNPYPSSNMGGTYPSSNMGGTYPSSNMGGTYPSSNMGGTYPSSNMGGTYPSSNMGGTYPSSNMVTVGKVSGSSVDMSATGPDMSVSVDKISRPISVYHELMPSQCADFPRVKIVTLLSRSEPTNEFVTGLSSVLREWRHRASAICATLAEAFCDSSTNSVSRLAIFFVFNDILQKETGYFAEPGYRHFLKVISALISTSNREADHRTYMRTVSIWCDRGVYPQDKIDKLKYLCRPEMVEEGGGVEDGFSGGVRSEGAVKKLERYCRNTKINLALKLVQRTSDEVHLKNSSKSYYLANKMRNRSDTTKAGDSSASTIINSENEVLYRRVLEHSHGECSREVLILSDVLLLWQSILSDNEENLKELKILLSERYPMAGVESCDECSS